MSQTTKRRNPAREKEMTKTEIQAAIAESETTDSIVTVQASLADVLDAARELQGDTDYARENDGAYDVWGWTDETPEGEQDWRLSLR